MNWNDLRIFLTAVRAGSYSAAGPQLNMNRTTVGRRVIALEEDVGVALFRETPTGSELTQAGRILLASAARMEAEMGEAKRAIGRSRPDPAPLRIASSAGIVVEFLGDLARFADGGGTPAVELTGALDPVDAVTHRRADLAIALIRTAPRRLAGRQAGIVAQAPYIRRGAPARPPLAWGTEVELALPRHWTAANEASDAVGAIRLNSWAAMTQAVRDGLGSAWLCCFSADHDPAIERAAAPDPRFDTGLWLLHRADTPQSAAAAELSDFLVDRISARLATQEA